MYLNDELDLEPTELGAMVSPMNTLWTKTLLPLLAKHLVCFRETFSCWDLCHMKGGRVQLFLSEAQEHPVYVCLWIVLSYVALWVMSYYEGTVFLSQLCIAFLTLLIGRLLLKLLPSLIGKSFYIILILQAWLRGSVWVLIFSASLSQFSGVCPMLLLPCALPRLGT